MKPKSTEEDFINGPGYSFARKGRFLHLATHRTYSEFEAYQRSLVASKPEILKNIKCAVDELAALTNKYSSFDLAAHLWFCNGLFDPESYRESESTARPFCIEYAALIELRNRDYRMTPLLVVEGADVERAQQLIEGIYRDTVMYTIAKGIVPGDVEPPSPLETAAFFGTLRKLTVGPSAYWRHWKEVLDGLFDRAAVRDLVESALGITYASVLQLTDAVSDTMATWATNRLKKVALAREHFQRDLDVYISTGKYAGGEDIKGVLDQLRNMRSKERKRSIQNMFMQWTLAALADQLSFSARSLSEGTGIGLDKVESFLKLFQTELGSTSSGFLLPSPTHQLRQRPIVNLGEKSFCPAPHLLIWAIKPSIEEVLRKHPSWETYQQHRASFLISETVKLFQMALPNSSVETSLYYPIGEDGREAELDALVMFDRYVFVIEGKAGSRKRAHKEEAIQARLAELTGDPARQAIRARDYLRSTHEPLLRRPDGTAVKIGDVQAKKLVPISVSLDSLDSFTSELSELAAINALKEPVWAVCLTDLRVIAELVSRPSEFTHFLRWRVALGSKTDIVGDRDEINWLGVYLKEGPKPPKVPEGKDVLVFASYTDEFDAYFLHKHGDRIKPAPRPAQAIPASLGRLMDAIEADAAPGFTEAVEFILDLTVKERGELSKAMADLVVIAKSSPKLAVVEVRLDESSVILASNTASENMQLNAEPTSVGADKPVLTLIVDPVQNWRVHGWKIRRP